VVMGAPLEQQQLALVVAQLQQHEQETEK